jgi:hypothetical protein
MRWSAAAARTERWIAGQDDDRHIQIQETHRSQKFDAGNAGHVEIGDDGVRLATRRQPSERLFSALHRLYRKAGEIQNSFANRSDRRLVIDQQDFGLSARHRCLLCRAKAR